MMDLAVLVDDEAHDAGVCIPCRIGEDRDADEERAERGDDVDLFFITGADALAQILTWRGAEYLFELAHFIGVTRPGVRLEAPSVEHLPADRITLLDVPALAISSTDCRKRVLEGLPIWYLVPDGIVNYINKRGLYQEM